MADDAAAKAEKLAAAKKRVEALKKKKTGGKKDKKEKASTEAKPAEDEADEQPASDDKKDADEKPKEDEVAAPEADETDDKKSKDDEDLVEKSKDEDTEDTVASPTTSPKLAVATPSLSEQSRLRSASFRHGGPLSPTGTGDGETAADIYRKQSARIEELERQNKRLTKDASDSEKRWRNAEDALADARDGGESSELSKLNSEIAALKRQNTQLQARTTSRHGASPSMSLSSPPTTEFETQLKAKTQTIETMELEMSRLRSQVERLSVGAGGDDDEGGKDGEGAPRPKHGRQEQVAALEEKLERAEKAAGSAQRELADLKRNLDRTSEKAVREGSARTSAETKLKTLEKENEDLQRERDELTKKVDGLEKKVTTLTTLHKEHDARSQALRRDKEKADRDLAEARTRVERIEAENLKLRKRDANDSGGTDDEHLDELLAGSPEQSELVQKLEQRVRELEAENTDLRSGIWHERRKELQVGPEDSRSGRHFSDVDLSSAATKRGAAGGSIGGFFSALAGGSASGDHHAAHGRGPSVDTDGFLDDDDVDFDEDAFRRAHEEEARLRIERVKETKRALKNWEGWRLDLVESRQGGAEGIGPIFEI
ncbi:hypothetical protein F503_08220 [Ophiostoma piceae UAMH 11346]|uniref:M protein repeat protein n=1 Tax=Ophiostoma piceae (strain UAMH 11346) TaxID=1262450 RepID=S3BWU4_OPHP1|nr:hypothetical protein F503_08220 [Ophiostoma piceae UAMH 11346]